MSRDKSGVYLVSAKSTGDAHYQAGIDNVAFSDDKSPAVDTSDTTSNDQSNPFIGMTKEELLKHSGKPFWRRMRMFCIGIVLIGWLALLVTVVALVLLYPKCKSPDARSWWQKEVIYRIYVRSFKDSNGDGIGDLKGVESKLDYIKGLGVGTISLSPVYQTDEEKSDQGITDHMAVKSEYGTLADLKSLIKAVHDKSMHIILDFIPNHTSDKHQWFTQSKESQASNDTYRNFYVWNKYKTNWKTMSGNDAWTMAVNRSEYYLHQSDSEKLPDLNLRSSQVQDELQKILQKWLDVGVDGFYVRDSAYLFEDYDMRDNPNAMDTRYTFGLPEINDMTARWRAFLNSANGSEKILMADINGDIQSVMNYYGHFQRDGVHLPLNQLFFDKTGNCNGACVKTFVETWMKNLPSGRWANWLAGDEHTSRIASRFNTSAGFLRAFTMLTMLLPGTPVIYYGDEIMLKDISSPISSNDQRAQRMRTLMQWNNDTNGGFQNGSCVGCVPWVPVNSDYMTNNVQTQEADSESYLKFVQKITSFRTKTSFVIGEYHLATVDDNIFSFVREFEGEKGYLVAINFGTKEVTKSFYGGHATIEMDATVSMTIGKGASYSVEDEVKTNSITLKPYEGVVVSWDYVAKEEL